MFAFLKVLVEAPPPGQPTIEEDPHPLGGRERSKIRGMMILRPGTKPSIRDLSDQERELCYVQNSPCRFARHRQRLRDDGACAAHDLQY